MFLRRAHHHAFTLIELLTALAILAILAVVLTFASQRVLSSTRQAKCVSNLRQIGAACLSFAADNDGSLPYEVKAPSENSSAVVIWTSAIEPYVPIPEMAPNSNGQPAIPVRDSIFFCPEAHPVRDWGGRAPDYGCAVRLNNRPGMDRGVFSRQGWGGDVPLVRLAAISQPSKVIMVADSYVSNVRAKTPLANGYWGLLTSQLTPGSISAAPPPSRLAPRHGYDGKDARTGRFNAVFCDGHVESISYGDPKLKTASYVNELTIPF